MIPKPTSLQTVKELTLFSPESRWLLVLVDGTHAYILTDCEEGNPVLAPVVGGS